MTISDSQRWGLAYTQWSIEVARRSVFVYTIWLKDWCKEKHLRLKCFSRSNEVVEDVIGKDWVGLLRVTDQPPNQVFNGPICKVYGPWSVSLRSHQLRNETLIHEVCSCLRNSSFRRKTFWLIWVLWDKLLPIFSKRDRVDENTQKQKALWSYRFLSNPRNPYRWYFSHFDLHIRVPMNYAYSLCCFKPAIKSLGLLIDGLSFYDGYWRSPLMPRTWCCWVLIP